MNLARHSRGTLTDNGAPAIDYGAWQSTVHAGRRKAAGQRKPVLVSYSERLPQGNALAVFDSARELGEASVFYWEQPTEGYALVGIGEAAARTSATINEMSSCWQALVDGAITIRSSSTVDNPVAPLVAGPVCFAGFAFDANSPRTELWQGFPSGLLLLPAVLFGSTGADAYLTINVVVTHPEEEDRGTNELQHRLSHIETVLRHLLGAWVRPTSSTPPLRRGRLTLHDREPRSAWKRMVMASTAAIREGAYRKIVLARSVEACAREPFAISTALADLGRRYSDAYIFALARGERTFLGASPERLAYVAGGRVETMALAGTEPRGISALEDKLLGEELLRQDKLQKEHAVVAETIREALAPLTSTLDSPSPPRLLKLHNVQHLMTPISGTLSDNMSVLQVVAALHPTPAVAGEPRALALEAIRQTEHLDRGWYAGPIGLIAADGSGEFAVALRSALVADRCATLFAGCGIVDGSDPDAEYAESIWKLQVMLESLGGED
jgi:isochorismate synthase